MSTPLTPFSNATITFWLDTGATLRDPRTGNLKPVRSPFTVRAFLKRKAADLSRNPYPGVDVRSVPWEGYATQPSQLPDEVMPGIEGDVEIPGLPASKFLVTATRSRYGNDGIGEILRTQLGDAIAGIMIYQGG